MPGRAPHSTYRLQINERFDLFAAARLVPYLHDLGVDWVYLSPLLAAEPGSDHGYDVIAHDHIDHARGGREGLAALADEAHRLGMGVLVDIVPNHVGVATPYRNASWWDLLTHGRGSVHADEFDVDWPAGGDRLRIPVIEDDDQRGPTGTIAHLSLTEPGPGRELRYHDQRYPIAPGTADDGTDANEVHDRQHYQLVNWRAADDQLNYRRFFAVSTLAGVRVEDRQVFEQTHVEIRRWFDDRLVDGLRVDHPDGLRHPAAYLHDLAVLTGGAYVLVEKILALRPFDRLRAAPFDRLRAAPFEELPADWETAGTTGYEVLAQIDRVLTDPSGEAALTDLDSDLRGGRIEWSVLVHDAKRAVADGILQSEVRRIAREIIAAGVPKDLEGMTPDAVAELLACFPVYRSYLPAGREHLDEAFTRARRRRRRLDPALTVLAPVLSDPASPAALRFQQTSGMVMAKGVEDCAFYRWSRLTSLNEVGGDPDAFAMTAGDFHVAMARRQERWPHAMTALSTHDTKRGEDVRARVAVLAERPDEWATTLHRLLELAPVPDAGFGNLLWQAVIGAWPVGRERLHGYAEKAMREAGDRTTWTEPDERYESAVHRAVDAAFDDADVRETVCSFVDRVRGAGWSNALSAKLIALTVPGAPDVYQGSELWEQSLVDPDNRRPVDFELRRTLLDSLPYGVAVPLSAEADDRAAAKLQLTRAALRLRRDRPELFTGYAGIDATGEAAGHVLAFDRGGAVTVATRLPAGLADRGGWGETTLLLPAGSWHDAVTGREYAGSARLAELMTDHPAVLLARS